MSETTDIMVRAAMMHSAMIEKLKKLSPRFPAYYIEGKGKEKGMEIAFSTLVPFEYKGRIYLRHHVEMYFIMADEPMMDIRPFYDKFMQSCKNSIKWGEPVDFEDPFGRRVHDEDITEEVRKEDIMTQIRGEVGNG
jgi:hypothetical protein